MLASVTNYTFRGETIKRKCFEEIFFLVCFGLILTIVVYTVLGNNVMLLKVIQETLLHTWFYNNFMVLSPDKCHFVLLGLNGQNFDFIVNNITIKQTEIEKVSRICTHKKQTFEKLINNLY